MFENSVKLYIVLVTQWWLQNMCSKVELFILESIWVQNLTVTVTVIQLYYSWWCACHSFQNKWSHCGQPRHHEVIELCSVLTKTPPNYTQSVIKLAGTEIKGYTKEERCPGSVTGYESHTSVVRQRHVIQITHFSGQTTAMNEPLNRAPMLRIGCLGNEQITRSSEHQWIEGSPSW